MGKIGRRKEGRSGKKEEIWKASGGCAGLGQKRQVVGLEYCPFWAISQPFFFAIIGGKVSLGRADSWLERGCERNGWQE